MINNNSPKEQLQLAEQLFCANDAYSSIIRAANVANNTASVTIVFNDIVQLVKGNNQAGFIKRAPVVINSINSNLTLRKLYLQLIETLTFADSASQAAASTGEVLPERVNEHFSLKFKRDKNHASQVYVILVINHPAEHQVNHAVALHITTSAQVDCLYFPVLTDGRSQLLMEEDDRQFKLLTDNNSHLYLM